MKGGAGDEEQQYESGKRIKDAVQRVGLPLRLDERTRGDGNCWYRAVIQQCRRASVGIDSLANHVELRSRVCQLALEGKLDVIKQMRKNWIRKESWRAYWAPMKGIWRNFVRLYFLLLSNRGQDKNYWLRSNGFNLYETNIN